MDYITVRELRDKSGEIWDRVEAGEEFVVTRNGKSLALLVHVAPHAVEERLRALRLSRMADLVKGIQDDARASGADRLTEADIEAEIQAARRERRASGQQVAAEVPPPPYARRR